MRCRVKRAYRDRLTGRYVLEGDTVELKADRARELAKGGFVEPPAKAPAKPKTRKE